MQDFGSLINSELDIISRRIRGMAMISRGIVPNLVLSQRAVDRIVHTAQGFIQDETGESMVGLVLPGQDVEDMPTIYVLDTISPDEATTVRMTHTFQQGDDLQDEIIWWLQENWRLSRELGLDSKSQPFESRFDSPLRYLGDWHKQPGYMIQPSGGDLMTALAWLDDMENQMEYLLVPIVTLGHPATTLASEGDRVNYFTYPMEDGTDLRMDWWYIHRDVRVFQPITPVILPEETFPAVADYPWHLVRPDRIEDEVALLQQEGMFVNPLVYQADDDIPMELCFFVARPGSATVLLLITEHNYPQTPPRAFTAPFHRFDPADDFYDIFEEFWAQKSPVDDLPAFDWQPESTLLGFIRLIESHLGIAPPPPPQPKAVSIAVDVDGEEDAPPVDGASADVASVDGASPDVASPDAASTVAAEPEPAPPTEAVKQQNTPTATNSTDEETEEETT